MRNAVRLITLTIVALSIAATVACTSSDSSSVSCPESWDQVTEYRLYFGRSDATGAPDTVSEEEWAQFLAVTVTPRIPEGLTVTDGSGQWQTESGEVLKEGTKILTLLVWPDDSDEGLINEISAEYERRFNQESVLRTSAQTCASFS